MADKLYDAILLNAPIEGQGEYLRDVDLFNLPYDRMSLETPLFILGDVDMGKSKSGQWPDFTHVGIYGTFDCSNFKINSDTILPGFFKELICKYSIGDLAVLIDKLQKIQAHDCKVVVRSALMNNIKKNKDGALDVARKFAMTHPTITVTDGKQTLSKILQDIDSLSVQAEPIAKSAEPVVPEIPLQTKEYLSAKDLAFVCSNTLAPDILQNLSKDLERYIKQALSKVSTIKMRRADDDVVVACVHKAEASNVIDAVIEYVQKDIEQSAKKSKPQPKSSASKAGKPSPVADAGLQSGGSKIVPQKIKKYISKSVWRQLKKATGTSTNILLQILQDIQDINIIPTETGLVRYIKDGKETISSNIERRGTNKCLSQRFDKTNNRPRIVWGIDGNVFVCQHYFADHGDNDRIEYNETLNKISLDISKLDLKKDFLLVSGLIKKLTTGKEVGISLTTESDTSVEPDATAQPLTAYEQIALTPVTVSDNQAAYVAPEQQTIIEGADVPTAPETVDTAGAEQPSALVRKKRPRITRAPQRVRYGECKINNRVQTPASCPQDTEISWVNMGELYGRFVAKYSDYSAHQKIILDAMARATDTYELIELNKELREILTAKRGLEQSLAELIQYNTKIQEIQKKLNGYSH